MSVMRVRGPNNVGRPVQTEQTLLRYTSAIAEQKKFWELKEFMVFISLILLKASSKGVPPIIIKKNGR